MKPFSWRQAHLSLSALAAGRCAERLFDRLFSGDRVDYRSAAVKINPLEVPPDLQQIQRDGRYQQQRGVRQRQHACRPPAGTVRTSAPVVAPMAGGRLQDREGRATGAG